MERANELQDAANKLEQNKIKEIETNNKVTSTHNTAIRWLTVAIVALGILTIWANYSKTGRYAISDGHEGEYVLNTKTSQLWIRTGSGHSLYLGTNENPAHEVIPIKPKNEQKQ